MSHFAYPNVLPKTKTFIGCGRYRVIPQSSKSPAFYQEVGETPNTPNKTQIEHALQILSPSSYDTDRIIIEKRDQPQHRYQGNSMDLAFFLAHSHLSRQLDKNISGDIWCTGAIEVKDGTPILRKVDDSGFQLKLSSFLDGKNPDTLFIVPAANIQKQTLETISQHSAEIFSLRQLGDKLTLSAETTKTILKVLPNELARLLELLFHSYRPNRHRKKWIGWGSLIIAACMIGLWYFINTERPDLGEIQKLLREGNLVTARQMVQQAEKNSPLLSDLKTVMYRSNDIEMTLVVRKKGEEITKKISVKESGRLTLTLSNEDDYRLTLSTHNPVDSLYLYILQIDESDYAYTLFPNIRWKLENPIEPAQWPLYIPEAQDEWLFLDQLPAVWKDGMLETLHVLVTPWRAIDIEATIGEIQAETDRNSRKKLIIDLKQQLNMRKSVALPSTTYRQCSFFHN